MGDELIGEEFILSQEIHTFWYVDMEGMITIDKISGGHIQISPEDLQKMIAGIAQSEHGIMKKV